MNLPRWVNFVICVMVTVSRDILVGLYRAEDRLKWAEVKTCRQKYRQFKNFLFNGGNERVQ